MGESTPVCQRYTDVMAHKYYPQHLLFNGTNNATATAYISDHQVKSFDKESSTVNCMCVLVHIIIHHICIYCRWKTMEIPV